MDFNDRVHFFAVAARLLRQILVDHARTKNRHKRGGGARSVTLDEAILVAPDQSGLVELDDALQRLAAIDRRKSEVVELLYFGGLTYDEIAAALDISPATVNRELRMAKAWLYTELASS
jgi:RNA polymerase sigma factor (TIGR02999 family)